MRYPTMAEFKKVFDPLDADGSGEIDSMELKPFLKVITHKFSNCGPKDAILKGCVTGKILIEGLSEQSHVCFTVPAFGPYLSIG